MKGFIVRTIIALILLVVALEYMPQANAQESDLKVEATETAAPDSAISESLKDDEEAPPPEAPYPGAAEEGFPQDNQPSSHEATSSAAASASQTIRLETPISKEKNGTWYYGVKESDRSFASSVRGGMFAAPKIQNPKNGAWFQDIYEHEQYPTFFFDFEWQLKTFLGDLGLKLGTGILYSKGTGKFADPNRNKDVPAEEFTFIMFPNTVSAIYRLQFADKQWIVPYGEAGAGYFTFMEMRDDGGKPKFAAAPTTFVAGGAAFLLDWLDPRAIRNMDREYGVNHVYLTAEFREIFGLSDKYDFSSRVISAGLMMEF